MNKDYYKILMALLAFLLVFIFGYYSNLSELVLQYKTLKNTEKNLQTQIASEKKILEPKSKCSSGEFEQAPHTLLPVILDGAVRHALRIESIESKPSQMILGRNTECFHLEVTGSFLHWTDFVTQLQARYPLVVTHLCIAASENETWKIDMDLTGTYLILPPSYAFPNTKITDPFVLPQKNIFKLEDSDERIFPLQQISLQQIKRRGTLQQGKDVRAILEFPNSAVTVVSKGALIGKENARILDINENEIIVEFPNHQQSIIR